MWRACGEQIGFPGTDRVATSVTDIIRVDLIDFTSDGEMKPHEALNHLSQLVRERVHFSMLHVHTKPPPGQVYNHRQLYLNHIMCDALNFCVCYVCWEWLWITKKCMTKLFSVHKWSHICIINFLNVFCVCKFSQNGNIIIWQVVQCFSENGMGVIRQRTVKVLV